MKKEKQIGVRVGMPVFFVLELENFYKRREGAHRALAFPDFVGLLVGMGLEVYSKRNAASSSGAPEGEDIEEEHTLEGEPLQLFNMKPEALHDLFREFDEAMEEAEVDPEERRRAMRLVPGDIA
jgi:hypothetical protein